MLPEAREAIAAEPQAAERAPGGDHPAGPGGGPEGGPAPVVLPFAMAGPSPPPATAASLSMEQTALALQTSLKVAQMMGMDTADVATALTSAAMAAARGGMGDAQKVLGEAYDRLEPAIGQRFEHMAMSLEDQEGRLREEGIAADVAREISRARRAFDDGARLEAVEALLRATQQMNELEGAWKLVKETLLRVDSLRDVGKRLGLDLSTADERLGQVRETLGESSLSATTLQEAGTQASAALVLLHEQVRNQVALLGQEAIRSLKAHPPPPGQREKAEARLKTILSHARAGRLKEASEEMVQFRASFLGGSPAAAPPSEATVPPGEAPSAAASPPAVPEVAPTPGDLPATPPPPEAAPSGPESSASTSSSGVEAAPPPSLAPGAIAGDGATVAGPPTAPEPSDVPPSSESPPSPEPATETRSLQQIVAEARELALQVKGRQQKKKDVKKAAGLLRELTALIKAGKAPEAGRKLDEVRAAVDEW